MRLVRWARLLPLPFLVACDIPTAPALPDGAEPFSPPPAFDLWWSMAQGCAGMSGALADVHWYVVPGARWVIVEGERYDGVWYKSGNRIVLAEDAMLDGPLVRHEMLHALAGVGHHSRDLFLARCGGVVSCDGACLDDAGTLPPPDLAVARVDPEALEVEVVLSPQAPSRSRYGGYFTMTVTARNPRDHPVVVTLPPPSDAGPSLSFEYRIELTAGSLMSNDRAWDDGVTRFAAGEVKRRVFDFYMTESEGIRGDGGLGPDTYRFRGAYGGHWAAVFPTVTLSSP
jgi:hypothetical protein